MRSTSTVKSTWPGVSIRLILCPLYFDAGCGTGDRDPTFSFQFHVVHGGTVTVTADLFDLVNPSGVEQDSLAQGRFARIDVSTDPDVSQFLQTHNFHLNSACDRRHSMGTRKQFASKS